jgi:opacity protein-like surface antigen
MKKVILAALASTVIASSASASFYAGVHGGTDVGRFMSVPEVTDKLTGIKLDRQLNGKGALEVGYNLMDNFGVALEVGGYLSPEYKKKDKVVNNDYIEAATKWSAADREKFVKNGASLEADVNHKFTIYSGMLKARLDLVDFDVAQIYVNAGAGVGYICEEFVVSTTKIEKKAESATGKDDGYPEVAANSPATVKMKPAYGLAAAGGLGVAFKLSDAMFLNVGVEYSYMGSTSKEFEDKSEDVSKTLSKDGKTAAFAGETKFDAINAVIGVRFNF